MVGIYKITNKLNGKSYIGQSIHCGKRLDEHYSGRNQLIDDTITLNGIENFSFEILKEVNQSELSYWEDYYILKFHTYYPDGYNKKWNSSSDVRKAISAQLAEDEKTEQSTFIANTDIQIHNDADICFLFNAKLFQLYCQLFYLCYYDNKQHLYKLDKRQLVITFLKRYFPNICYNTLSKYVKILQDWSILKKEDDYYVLTDISLITETITLNEFRKDPENIGLYWYIKFNILKKNIIDFSGIDFRWIYAIQSIGNYSGGKQCQQSEKRLNQLIKNELLILDESSSFKKKKRFILNN